MSNAAIARIIDVIDTREFELDEQTLRYKPVPGTGEENLCDRCGKAHVIHAHVELADGTRAIVGTTCADRESMAFKQLRGGASKATRRAKLEAELRGQQALAARYEALQREVAALPLPALTVRPLPAGTLDGWGQLDDWNKTELELDGHTMRSPVPVTVPGIASEKRRATIELGAQWRSAQLSKLTGKDWAKLELAAGEVKRLQRKLG